MTVVARNCASKRRKNKQVSEITETDGSLLRRREVSEKNNTKIVTKSKFRQKTDGLSFRWQKDGEKIKKITQLNRRIVV